MNKKWLLVGLAATSAFATSITVSSTKTNQEVLGFGGGVVYYQNWVNALSTSMKEDLFDTAFTGLNLSLLRLGNWMQNDSVNGSLSIDSMIVAEGRARLGDHFKIEMSSWSAPDTIKISGSVNGTDGSGQSNTLSYSTSSAYGDRKYESFAHWWKVTYQAYYEMGIEVDYVSMQNEPDMDATYAATLFGPSESYSNDTIAGYAEALHAVYDSMQTLTISKPALIGPEVLGIGYNNFQNYVNNLDTSYLGGYAYHLYHAGSGNDDSKTNYSNAENFSSAMTTIGNSYASLDASKPIIMTEFCTMQSSTEESDMVGLAHIMQVGFTDGQINGYIAWELLWGEEGQLIGVCPSGWGGCTSSYLEIGPEYHAMRHYSKFVNPGWYVVSSTSSDDDNLKVVAFRSEDADSVALVAINISSSAISLESISISGFYFYSATQSVEDGSKSQVVDSASAYTLPARSITTFVFAADGTTPVDPEEEEEDGSCTAEYEVTIVDFEEEESVGTWTSDVATAPSLVTTALDGVSQYAYVPFAGCSQSEEDCGYQNVRYTMPEIYEGLLGYCETLNITAYGVEETNYVNVGAVGEEWIDFQYGVAVAQGEWTTVSVDLEKEGDNASTQLKFNSDYSGIYISKITASGCCDLPESMLTPIRQAVYYSENVQNYKAVVYDLKGNRIWTGLRKNALNENGTLSIDVSKGAYILKTKAGASKVLKK